MDKQALIDRAVAAGMDAEDANRLISNAPFMAKEYGMNPITTLEQFAGLLLYKARKHLDYVANSEPFQGDKGICLYDAAAWLTELNTLSLAGIYPVSQRELFPQKENEMTTPLYVVKELARIRESAVTNMLDHRTVESLARDKRAAEWLEKCSASQYMEALNDMGKADSDEFLDDSPRQPRPSDEDDFGGVELDPISGLPEHLFRNDEDYDDEEEDNESAF